MRYVICSSWEDILVFLLTFFLLLLHRVSLFRIRCDSIVSKLHKVILKDNYRNSILFLESIQSMGKVWWPQSMKFFVCIKWKKQRNIDEKAKIFTFAKFNPPQKLSADFWLCGIFFLIRLCVCVFFSLDRNEHAKIAVNCRINFRSAIPIVSIYAFPLWIR